VSGVLGVVGVAGALSWQPVNRGIASNDINNRQITAILIFLRNIYTSLLKNFSRLLLDGKMRVLLCH
jgi:hypothetical protein